MKNSVKEVIEIANEIIEAQWSVSPIIIGVTPFEALQIAVKIQRNQILEKSYQQKISCTKPPVGYPELPKIYNDDTIQP